MKSGGQVGKTRDDITDGGSLVTKDKQSLPKELDVIIVGSGPSGTAAAFRAKELGLASLVIDRDDVLAILRDWIALDGNQQNDKKVDSAFGPGGARVPFPVGDALVESLVFGNQVPASEVYAGWMKTYRDNNIMAKVGYDLTGLKPSSNGMMEARCYFQQTRKEETFLTRFVILAMGRGVPNKLDIPGDTVGVNYKLRDPNVFVGGPALVVGGGTSAAEAVIAISKAKAAGGDKSDVFWSYRRKNLPKVNPTLADSFFETFAGNGNIRTLPVSAPLAVLKESGDVEVIALRSERRETQGMPPEGSYFEFPKERVLACIGADLPIEFLNAIGIRMLKSADAEEEFMAVSPIFESQVPNVFLIGDLLAPAYIQTTNFSPEAVQSVVKTHIGNFRQGMLDGVLAIEAIKKRKDGLDNDKIAKFLTEKMASYEEVHKKRKLASPAAPPAAAEAAKAQEQPPAVRIGAKFARMVAVDDKLEEKEETTFNPGRVVIGHTQGDLCFPDDEMISDNHFAIEVNPDACYVTLEGMKGQCWIDLKVEREVKVGDTFLAGDQMLKITALDSLEVLNPQNPSSRAVNRLYIREGANTYGRAQITPDENNRDKRLSRRHFSLQLQGSAITLRDFGSKNGTYLPVTGALRLSAGDELYFGNEKRLRFKGLETGSVIAPAPQAVEEKAQAKAAEPKAKEKAKEKTMAQPAAPAAQAGKAPAASGGPAVSVVNKEIAMTFQIGPEITILDKLRQLGMATKTDQRDKLGGKCQNLYDCEKGNCGLCIIRVVGGAENLSKANGREKRTAEGMVEALNTDQGRTLNPEECRLACCAKVAGPVEVELLGNTDAAG